VVVKNSNNLPVAIGQLAISISAIKGAAEKKGKAVKILHYLKDELWRFGTELIKITSPEASLEETKDTAKKLEETKDTTKEEVTNGIEEENKEEAKVTEELSKEENKEEDKGEEQHKNNLEAPLDTKEMDKTIYEAFMNALKISVKGNEFPIEPSVLANTHMKYCTEHKLDFNLSSYKRVILEFKL